MKGDDVNPNDDMKYQDVINTLSQLQQVKAPAGFEADLMRKINSESFPEEKTFWQNIFAPSRLVPAGALAVTALILIFLLDTTGVGPGDPLLTAPRERGDVTLSAKADNLSAAQKSVERDEAVSSEQTSGIQKDKGIAEQPANRSTAGKEGYPLPAGRSLAGRSGNNDRFITAKFTSGRIADYPVNKAGLNFRQVNLSNEQKTQLNELKQKLETTFNSEGRH